jgi:hypothetical protein
LSDGLLSLLYSLVRPFKEDDSTEELAEEILLDGPSKKETPSRSPLKPECSKTFPAMVVSVVKGSRDAGMKSVNIVHLVDRAYEVWPRELKKAFVDHGAGAAFIFQAIPMHALDVCLFVLLPLCMCLMVHPTMVIWPMRCCMIMRRNSQYTLSLPHMRHTPRPYSLHADTHKRAQAHKVCWLRQTQQFSAVALLASK